MRKKKEAAKRRFQRLQNNKYPHNYRNLAKIVKMKMNSNNKRIVKTRPTARIQPM